MIILITFRDMQVGHDRVIVFSPSLHRCNDKRPAFSGGHWRYLHPSAIYPSL
jgi:hypothetical protein